MLKRFLLAAIVSLIVLSSQIAVAADIDWNSVPQFSNKAQLARYFENKSRQGFTEFNFILPSMKVNNQSELDRLCSEFQNNFIAIAPHADLVTILGTGRFTYRMLNEYPGTRVANAYRSQDKYQAWLNLTADEQKLYNIAVGIVDEANKRSSAVEKACYIHNEICKRVKDWKSHTNENAIGALVIGITNCQGFADSFYMLCRMCNLDVVRIHGLLNGETHAWNVINFGDGKFYFVDVLYDYQHNSFECFKVGRADMEKLNYKCEWGIIPNLQ